MFDDTQRLSAMIVVNFDKFIPKVLAAIGIIVYLFYMNFKLAFIVFVTVPLILKVVLYFSTKLKRLSSQLQQKLADLTHLVNESTQNMKMVQSFNLQEKSLNRFHSVQFKNLRSQMREIRSKCIQEPLIAYMQFLTMLLVMWYGGYLVVQK